MPLPVLPRATASSEEHADWLELRALTEGYVSWTDYARALGVGGTMDAVDDDEGGLETIVDGAIEELGDRRRACGNPQAYPFTIDSDGLGKTASAELDVYEFLLVLSLLGAAAGEPQSHPERLFEDLCGEALRRYLGGIAACVEVRMFGFPRRIMHREFCGAVDELCRSLGEGVSHQDEPESSAQKDAHLDVVAWRGFPDERAGKLIAFGQCATGDNWVDKMSELRPRNWCKLWLHRQPLVDPIGAFFIPHRPERRHWRRASVEAGVLFDRCRIAWLVSGSSGGTTASLRKWTERALAEAS